MTVHKTDSTNSADPETPSEIGTVSHFGDRLITAIQSKQTPLVVGIDPRLHQLPDQLKPSDLKNFAAAAEAFQQFSCGIIDVVADLVPAVKPQAAFFEMLGPHGMMALAQVIDHATAAGLLVIMDAKRGDIGSTAAAYASAYLGRKPHSPWGCDALTVNPYLGFDTLEPFVDAAKRTGSGIFVLAKTSNPGSHSIQDRVVDKASIYALVADEIQRLSAENIGTSGYGNIGAVVGATYQEQLIELRAKMPNTIFLIPGFGAQGGTADDVAGGLDENGLGAVINSSRGIIFAHQREPYKHLPTWQAAVEQATKAAIDQIAAGTTAAKLLT
jgi:orotidine-5'-phosphate decarboxylase